jgi:hypothetical protein
MRRKKENDTGGHKENKRKNVSFNRGNRQKNTNSILKIHEEKMSEFSKTNQEKAVKELNHSISKKLQEIESLKKDIALKSINNPYFSNGTSDMQSKTTRLREEIESLKKDLNYITSGRKESDYILSTCYLINDYVLLEENERDLMIQEDKDVEQELYQINQKKNDIIDEYMKIIDPNYTSFRHSQCNIKDIYCVDCNIYLQICGGFAVCYECGKSVSALHQAEELSYKELQEIDYRPQFTYQKETHLEDWLRRFQAKEHKEIPQEVLDKVVMEAHKQRITDLSTLTELQVKKFLKKLDLNEYYDNVISIINRINKRPPFILTSEVETKIKEMFQQIQAPFEKYKDPNRKNMLSYSYLLHHFFLILGLPEFSQYFFLLKSPEKLRQQDQTFKKIVEELAKTDPKTPWKFYPSL